MLVRVDLGHCAVQTGASCRIRPSAFSSAQRSAGISADAAVTLLPKGRPGVVSLGLWLHRRERQTGFVGLQLDLRPTRQATTPLASALERIKGSLLALQNHNDNKYPGMKVCFASSADTELAERIGRATLKLLEVVPGTTVWDLVVKRDWEGEDVNQIGRRPPLSANKSTTHFPILRELTRIRYDRQLFFDDCQVRWECSVWFRISSILAHLVAFDRAVG